MYNKAFCETIFVYIIQSDHLLAIIHQMITRLNLARGRFGKGFFGTAAETDDGTIIGRYSILFIAARRVLIDSIQIPEYQ